MFQGIVCAQSFHWFSQAGIDEIYRVLKPGGNLVLIFNTFDLNVPWLSAVINYCGTYFGPSEPWNYDLSWKTRLDANPGFYIKQTQDRLPYPSEHVCFYTMQ